MDKPSQRNIEIFLSSISSLNLESIEICTACRMMLNKVPKVINSVQWSTIGLRKESAEPPSFKRAERERSSELIGYLSAALGFLRDFFFKVVRRFYTFFCHTVQIRVDRQIPFSDSNSSPFINTYRLTISSLQRSFGYSKSRTTDFYCSFFVGS